MEDGSDKTRGEDVRGYIEPAISVPTHSPNRLGRGVLWCCSVSTLYGVVLVVCIPELVCILVTCLH